MTHIEKCPCGSQPLSRSQDNQGVSRNVCLLLCLSYLGTEAKRSWCGKKGQAEMEVPVVFCGQSLAHLSSEALVSMSENIKDTDKGTRTLLRDSVF